ncbi:MAG: FAD-dependent oxidoreductase [Rhodospirillaceae bacterium]
MSPAYPKLFTPIRVGHLELANRVLMGSMHTGLEDIPGLARLAAFLGARARGGAALLVTGGFSPIAAGRLKDGAASFDAPEQVADHRRVTQAVHEGGGRVLLQVLHAGRYGYHADIVAPSAIKAPIAPTVPREMTAADIEDTIAAFAATASLAKQAGYDGVEIMGSEGYLLTQFLAPRTNHRSDEWGGSPANRMRFPLEVVRAVRAAAGPDFVIMFRISVLDLVEGAPEPAETLAFARELEAAGVEVLNSGIGWHEAPVPTIAQAVPPAAFARETARFKAALSIPLVASNRINMPEIAEAVLAAGQADMVSMARPFLADADFVAKAGAGRADTINICIACNQSCLDHYFTGKVTSCLVNPVACFETELVLAPAARPKKIAVVGAGPGGLAAADAAQRRGHAVTLFEAAGEIGGQFNLAKRIPGKAVFADTLLYFRPPLAEAGVEVRLGVRAEAKDLIAEGFDAVVLATGITPRRPNFPGIDGANVTSYVDVLSGRVKPEGRVVIIGGGGIAFDTALYLLEAGDASFTDADAFRTTWIEPAKIDAPPVGGPGTSPGVTMVQRSQGAMGRSLGKSTGWIHRAALRRHGVRQVTGAAYERIDDAGLHIVVEGKAECLAADWIVVCAGQEPQADLAAPLAAAGIPVHRIGGAKAASGLDAAQAIREGVELASNL